MSDVYLYEDSNYTGRKMVLGTGLSYTPIDPQQFGVSSITVPVGCTVTLSSSQKSLIYAENTNYPYVGDDMNDRVIGVEVTPICDPGAGVC